MLTRIFYPLLTLAAAGSLALACGSPDRIFVELDSGVPPRDSSSGSDASPDAVAAADQQNDSGANGDGAVLADAPPVTDGGADAVSDGRVPSDGGAPDIVVSDTAIDSAANDAAAPDTAVNDTAANDTTAGDVPADMGGPTDGGWTSDVKPDILDCSSTPVPRISPSGSVGVCPGKTITLTSTPAASYVWSTSATTQAIDVGAAGSYTVTTTDTRGCVGTSAPTVVSVYQTPPPTITANGSTRICSGDSVTLSTGAASSYLWSTGETTQSIVVTGPGNYYVTTTDAYGCGVSMTSPPTSVTVVTPSGGSRYFTFLGGPDTFVVPECVTSVIVDAYGAQGGSANSPATGGYGGEVYARLNVIPGSVLQIRIGGAGTLCTVDNGGGFNGGGPANCAGVSRGSEIIYSATGGGATDIRVSPYGLADRVVVAGGGGGAGYNCYTAMDSGGSGGGDIGGTYPTTCGAHPESAGNGGTQTSGGVGGTYPNYGYAGNGQYGLGGSGVSTGGNMASEGGGGGGGYFGGGGGCWVGGGGGSDYLRPSVVTPFGQYQGVQSGHGALYLNW